MKEERCRGMCRGADVGVCGGAQMSGCVEWCRRRGVWRVTYVGVCVGAQISGCVEEHRHRVCGGAQM